MHSPYLLDNIKIVANRIIEAIKNNEKIGISYDIDADGICSGTIMYRYLKNFTENIICIYHQREKGHGISVQEIPTDINLLIVVDSSTNETKKCQQLKEQGIDIVILDHHPKTKFNPYAVIVNPQLDQYPNKELSGSGVVFKCCEVLDDILETFYAYQYIDLACVGLIADVMSMDEPENRFIVYNGLKKIKNPGLNAILRKGNVYDINSEAISFKVGPVINACARMNKIEKIIKLLKEDDNNKCLILAKECIALNEKRKRIQAKLFKKIKNRVDDSHKIIIVETFDNEIDKGFNGLLAMQIAQHYKKPTLVVKNHNGVCAGSGRGIDNIPLKELLQETELFNYIAGHSLAFGCSFKRKYLDDIYEFVDKNIKEQKEQRVIEYDMEINKDNIDYDFIKQIEQFNHITGKNCEPTKFVIKNLPIEEIRVLGKMEDTIKIQSDVLDLIKFRVNKLWYKDMDVGDIIDVVGKLNINKYYNFGKRQWIETLQMFIDDYKPSSYIKQ